MKYTTYILMGLFVFSPIAFAQTATVSTGAQATVRSDSDLNSKGETREGISGQNSADDSATDIDTSVQAVMQQTSKEAEGELRDQVSGMQKSLEQKKEIRNEVNASDDSKDDQDSDDDSQDITGSSVFKMLNTEVRGWDQKQKDEIIAKAALLKTIASKEDLSTLTQAALAGDDNIKDMTVADDHVDMSYNQSAKLFGFIPIKLKVSSSIDAAGKVKVKFPWLARFSKTNKTSLDAEIAKEQAKLDSIGDQTEIDQLKLQQMSDKRAKMIEMLSNLMKKASDTANNITQNLK